MIFQRKPKITTSVPFVWEEPPDRDLAVWEDLDTFAEMLPDWGIIAGSAVYKDQLAPWFKRMLLETMRRMAIEPDPDKVRLMQIRAQLLEGLLTEPYLALSRKSAAMENRRMSGEED